MVVYTCKRCGYSCNNKSYYRKHLLRKIPCEPLIEDIKIEDLLTELSKKKNKDSSNIKLSSEPKKYAEIRSKYAEKDNLSVSYAEIRSKYAENTLGEKKQISCIYCGKNFKSERYRVQHVNRGHCVSAGYHKIEQSPCNNPPLNEKDVIIASQTALIKELRSQIELLIKEKGNTYNYSQNIIIQPFGKENLAHIKSQYVKDLIQTSPVKCIPRLLKAIHFNEEHKENQNIKIPNKKQALAQIFNGTDWVYKDKKDTIDNMTNKAYGIINEHYTGDSSYMDDFKKQYENEDKEVLKKVVKETEVMILNNQISDTS